MTPDDLEKHFVSTHKLMDILYESGDIELDELKEFYEMAVYFGACWALQYLQYLIKIYPPEIALEKTAEFQNMLIEKLNKRDKQHFFN